MSQEQVWDSMTELYPLLNRAQWRIIGMITEEAGELQGAFNKWQDGLEGFPHKNSKGYWDVLEELIQVIACGLLAAHHFGITEDELWAKVNYFYVQKRIQIS